jgi:ABC-2 type transport system ATP-binding protein
MVEVCDLTKRYGSSRGVSNVSFTVKEGEVVGFLGPNGAGKTTTMNILTGYLSATSGAVRVAGIDVLENPMAAKRHMGYLPEHPPLYLDMTVCEYLNFMYELKSVRSPDRKKVLLDVCELVGIEQVWKRVIKNLSKGYRQRVGLAQALLGDPDVLILDEPTVGLDPGQIREIRKTIGDLGKKRTVILSTHILPEVSAVCERVVIISNGRIVADGRLDELKESVGSNARLVVRLPGNPADISGLLKRIDSVRHVEVLSEAEKGAFDYAVKADAHIDVRKPLFDALSKASVPILKLTPEDTTLEDIFLKLVSGETGIYDEGSESA